MASTITVDPSQRTLFQVAAEYLGDATQWNRIADLNGLNDPIITAIADLAMPPVDPTQGGGIPQP